MKKFEIFLDVSNRCNLRCPSCPQGNSAQAKKAAPVFLKKDDLVRMLHILVDQVAIDGIGLYNWTEPLLHPDLASLVTTVKEFGLTCSISSNLNTTKNIRQVLESDPDAFYVSVSGWLQETYAKHHCGGNIEKVKKNLLQVKDLLATSKSHTKLTVLYHLYKDNLHEKNQMKSFAEMLQSDFFSYVAHFAPIEKIIDYLDRGVPLTEKDQQTVASLLYSPEDLPSVPDSYKETACDLQQDSLAIDVFGNVSVCCATFEDKFIVGNILKNSIEEIQNSRETHKFCDVCKKYNGNIYYTRKDVLLHSREPIVDLSIKDTSNV